MSVDGAGYHFTTPAGWTFTPAKGNWEEGHGNYPDLETPGFAEFFAPDVTADIVIGRRAATGLTLQAWIAALTRSGTLEYPAVFCRPRSRCGRPTSPVNTPSCAGCGVPGSRRTAAGSSSSPFTRASGDSRPALK